MLGEERELLLLLMLLLLLLPWQCRKGSKGGMADNRHWIRKCLTHCCGQLDAAGPLCCVLYAHQHDVA
jgi:hypothetical protein